MEIPIRKVNVWEILLYSGNDAYKCILRRELMPLWGWGKKRLDSDVFVLVELYLIWDIDYKANIHNDFVLWTKWGHFLDDTVKEFQTDFIFLEVISEATLHRE